MRRSATLLAAVAVAAGLVTGAGSATADPIPSTISDKGAVSDNGLGAKVAAAKAEGGNRFVPMRPLRVLDTRNGTGRPGTHPVGQGQTVTLSLASVVPMDTNALVLNVTGTGGTGSTYVTVYPTGASKPGVSNLNLVRGETRSNAVMTYIGMDGTIKLYNNFGSVHLIADLAGYFTESTEDANGVLPGAYTAVSPVRVLDSRTSGGKFGPRQTRTIDFSSRVPAGTTSVALNLTGVDATLPTYVTAWPNGVSRPTASSLNLSPSVATPNAVTVALGPDRKLNLYNNGGMAHLIVDLAGYYNPNQGKLFYPFVPFRDYDSRSAGDYWGPGWTYDFYYTDPAAETFSAIMVNITGTNVTTSTHFTAYPSGQSRPNASVLNLSRGQTAPNMATVTMGRYDGYPSVAYYNNAGSIDVIIDVFGIYSD